MIIAHPGSQHHHCGDSIPGQYAQAGVSELFGVGLMVRGIARPSFPTYSFVTVVGTFYLALSTFRTLYIPRRERGLGIAWPSLTHRKAIVLTHTSEQNSLCDDFVPWANQFPEVQVILAHIGHGWDGDITHQVRAIQKSQHGNMYADTSSARSITPNLIEWAVREVGAERVLFGTDTPLYSTAMQRARINHASLSDADKRLILRDNAVKLFGSRLG